MTKAYATLTSKGQLTVPREVREAWGLKPGDKIGFEVLSPREGRVEPMRRRSIFEGLDELTVRSPEPLSQADLDTAIDEDLSARFDQSRWKAGS